MDARISKAQRTRQERCLYCRAPLRGPERAAGDAPDAGVAASAGRCSTPSCPGRSGEEAKPAEGQQVLVESRRANIILLVALGATLLTLHIILEVFLSLTGSGLWIAACTSFALACASATARALHRSIALTWRRIASDAASLRSNAGRVVCLTGPAEAAGRDLTTPAGEPCLWFETEQQRRPPSPSGAREGAWLYVGDSKLEYCLPLRMGDATVANQPSEVAGGEREVEDLPSNADGSQRRRVTRRLVHGAQITVVGRLRQRGEGYHIDRSPWSGLLLTTEPWRERRRKELWETVGFAFLTAALAALAIW